MSNQLEKPGLIDTGKLNSEFYFTSLIEQAALHGMIDAAGIQKLQYDALALLSKITEEFNAGASSSVPLEQAQSLMTSLLFTVSLALKAYSNPGGAVRELLEKPLEEFYRKGLICIKKLLATTKTVHAKLCRELIPTENTCYHETLLDGIKGFFKIYNSNFGAHEIHITADYPLLVPLPPLAGIEFIKTYTDAAYYENKFLSFFAADSLHYLLCGYTNHYKDLVINLYEPAFRTALGCALCGVDIRSLSIPPRGKAYLEKLFLQTSESEIADLLSGALQTVLQTFDCTDGLNQYMKDSLPLTDSGIKASLKAGTLRHFFSLPFYPEEELQLLIPYGRQMENRAYRQLLNEIHDSEDSDHRLKLVLKCIHSLADLETILLDADFMENEVLELLGQLSLPQIAALLHRYRSILEDDCYGLLESELRLRVYLKAFLKKLSNTQLRTLEKTEKQLKKFY